MSAKKRTANKGGKGAKRATSPKRKAPKRAASKPRVKAKVAKTHATKARAAPAKKTAKNAAKKSAKKSAKPAAKILATRKPAKPVAIKRRDGAGHLDPQYAAGLLALRGDTPKDDNRAFLRKARSGDSLTEELGEEFVEAATSGEDEGNEIRDQRVTEELGGPFTVTSSNTEFAAGVDRSNPKNATREPFPKS